MNKNKSILLGLLSFFFFALSPSSASALQYTQTQCLAAGGSYAASSADCTNTRGSSYFSIGDYVDATCVVKGVCCAQGSAAPSGPGCTAPVAGSSGCGGGSGVCKIGCSGTDRVINDDFNGDGVNDTCKNFSAGGTVCCEPLAAASSVPTTGLNYQLLEKIPGTDNLSGSDLPGYVSALYKVALVVVTLSAVLMLSIGGFMYLTSAGNVSALSTAKGIIYDSLIGLVIALFAWLVLYIINPDLVEITLNGLPSVATAPAPTGTVPVPGPGGALPAGSNQDLADQILKSGNITLNGSGSCKSPAGEVTPRKNITDIRDGKLAARCSNGCQTKGTAGCTENNANLSNKMLAAILAVSQTQRFTITSIAGGPHASSSKHFSGNAIDIVPVSQALMDAFIRAGAYPPNGNSASMCENTSGMNVGCNAGSGADHIHLVF